MCRRRLGNLVETVAGCVPVVSKWIGKVYYHVRSSDSRDFGRVVGV